MDLAVEKVAHIIVKAREYDAKVSPWDDDTGLFGESMDAAAALETRRDDLTSSETAQFIALLNDDEQAELVALTWIGRGTFEAEDWEEAVETARAERVTDTAGYLMGIPLLADYLEEGLERLGYSVEDAEEGIL